MRRPKASWTEVDAAIDRWVEAGLVERSDWHGVPLLATPLPRVAGIWFDAEAVERVLKFFTLLKQLVGRWAGHEFVLLDWQVRHLLAPVFGLKAADGRRVIRTVWFEIPRKNGKSTICSGLALYLLMADREPAAQVFAAAGDKPQAGIVFRGARDMATNSLSIADALGKRGIQRSLLEHPRTGSVFRALSSDGARQHGLNVHGAIIDEVHVHKKPDLVEALETGTGSREQPLVVFITTAGTGADGSVYAMKREYLEGVVSGTVTDPTFFGRVFGVDATAEGFDPFDEATIRAANPGYGVTVLGDYLARKASEAQQSPSQLNTYLRLHLNVRTKQTVRWLTLGRWDAGGQLVNDNEWDGRTGYAGLDLSSTTDLTAFALLARDDAGAVMVRPLFWLPEERIGELERRCNVPLARWAREGFLRRTEGNIVDYAQVRADILAEVKRLNVNLDSICYDPWNATETVGLLEQEGVVMVPTRQGYGSLSAPAKELERLVMGSEPTAPLLRHGGHPVLRWCADCVEVRSDDGGNIKPSKPDRGKSTKRIDGIAAMVNALSRLTIVDEGPSVYEERGLLVL